MTPPSDPNAAPSKKPKVRRVRLTLIRSLVSDAQIKTGTCGTTVRIHQLT